MDKHDCGAWGAAILVGLLAGGAGAFLSFALIMALWPDRVDW